MKSGFVAIVGRPNAGKSTLINTLVKSKISIISSKPQTTRNCIQGIYNDGDSQIVFIDTPGVLKPHQRLDQYMDRQINSSLEAVDALIVMIDASVNYNEEKDKIVQDKISNIQCPIILVFNKIDLTTVATVESLKAKYKEMLPNAKIIEISALNNLFVDDVVKEIKSILPEGRPFYPEDVKSDHPLSFLISEIIREKILDYLHDEVPHCVAVKLEKIEHRDGYDNIYATIVVEKESQKGIVIGKGGQMIKKIGVKSRQEIEQLLGTKVNLKTFVRVEEKWRDTNTYLKEFGYTQER